MLHIQILLYNSERFLEGLIRGLDNVPEQDQLVVHFLENSEQNSKEKIADLSPKFKYTHDRSGENLGFGRGHNWLFNKYKADYDRYFLVLNHDTLPFFTFFTEFQKFRRKIDSGWGAIELAQLPKSHPKEYDPDSFETEWTSAATIIYRTQLFEVLGGFDESMFMYCEDVDLAWRIKQTGHALVYCPFAKFGHITRDLDTEKDPSFEEIHSKAGNLYMRHKYFGKEEVDKYMHLIHSHPNIKEIEKEFAKILERSKNHVADFSAYRKYDHPKLYPDTNYAFHRWT